MKRILLVEQDKVQRHALKERLLSFKMILGGQLVVLEAEDTERALEMVIGLPESKRPDLVITDIAPEVNGIILASQLSILGIAAILMTAVPVVEYQVDIPANVRSVLKKPFRPPALITAVRNALDIA